MFYRPEFCNSCGEKIERVDQGFWKSSRFCDVCAAKHGFVELIEKVIPVAGLGLMMAAVITMWSLPRPMSSPLSSPAAKRGLTSRADISYTASPKFDTTATKDIQSQSGPVGAIPPQAQITAAPTSPAREDETGKAETVYYYCGAATKKGTFCTRRVKGNVRCWQHQGMPAMLPAAKLVVSASK